MRVRHVTHVLGALAVSAVLAGCHSAQMPIHYVRQSDGSRLITRDQLQYAHSTNAWDLLREVGTDYRFVEDVYGNPARLRSRRGKSSFFLSEADIPVLVIDGIRQTDMMMLRTIPTDIVLSIRLLSGIDGTTLYGTNSGAGVIVLTTMVPVDVAATDTTKEP